MADYTSNTGGSNEKGPQQKRLMKKEYTPTPMAHELRRFVKRELKPVPSIGKLDTKKAQTLKTSADAPKEIIQKTSSSVSPIAKKSKVPMKDKIVHALNKASMAIAKRSKDKTKTGILGKKVTKTAGMTTRTVDGSNQAVREKTKTVTRKDGTVKKTVTKGRGVMGSVIGRYKDVKRYKK